MNGISPTHLAKIFTKLSINEGVGITLLTVPRLMYIANGFSLAMLNKKITNHYCLTGKYGPKFLDFNVLEYAKKFGSRPIPKSFISFFDNFRYVDSDRFKIIKSVWDAYKIRSGVELMCLIGKPGTPYYHIHETYGENVVIPDDLIKEYYSNLLDNAQQAVDREYLKEKE